MFEANGVSCVLGLHSCGVGKRAGIDTASKGKIGGFERYPAASIADEKKRFESFYATGEALLSVSLNHFTSDRIMRVRLCALQFLYEARCRHSYHGFCLTTLYPSQTGVSCPICSPDDSTKKVEKMYQCNYFHRPYCVNARSNCNLSSLVTFSGNSGQVRQKYLWSQRTLAEESLTENCTVCDCFLFEINFVHLCGMTRITTDLTTDTRLAVLLPSSPQQIDSAQCQIPLPALMRPPTHVTTSNTHAMCRGEVALQRSRSRLPRGTSRLSQTTDSFRLLTFCSSSAACLDSEIPPQPVRNRNLQKWWTGSGGGASRVSSSSPRVIIRVIAASFHRLFVPPTKFHLRRPTSSQRMRSSPTAVIWLMTISSKMMQLKFQVAMKKSVPRQRRQTDQRRQNIRNPVNQKVTKTMFVLPSMKLFQKCSPPAAAPKRQLIAQTCGMMRRILLPASMTLQLLSDRHVFLRAIGLHYISASLFLKLRNDSSARRGFREKRFRLRCKDETFELLRQVGRERCFKLEAGISGVPLRYNKAPLLGGAGSLKLSSSGSGKTAAFLLPILERLAQSPAVRQRRRSGTGEAYHGGAAATKALILLPTRVRRRKISTFNCISTVLHLAIIFIPRYRCHASPFLSSVTLCVLPTSGHFRSDRFTCYFFRSWQTNVHTCSRLRSTLSSRMRLQAAVKGRKKASSNGQILSQLRVGCWTCCTLRVCTSFSKLLYWMKLIGFWNLALRMRGRACGCTVWGGLPSFLYWVGGLNVTEPGALNGHPCRRCRTLQLIGGEIPVDSCASLVLEDSQTLLRRPPNTPILCHPVGYQGSRRSFPPPANTRRSFYKSLLTKFAGTNACACCCQESDSTRAGVSTDASLFRHLQRQTHNRVLPDEESGSSRRTYFPVLRCPCCGTAWKPSTGKAGRGSRDFSQRFVCAFPPLRVGCKRFGHRECGSRGQCSGPANSPLRSPSWPHCENRQQRNCCNILHPGRETCSQANRQSRDGLVAGVEAR
eukprot:284816599_5